MGGNNNNKQETSLACNSCNSCDTDKTYLNPQPYSASPSYPASSAEIGLSMMIKRGGQ